jgi:hypothetical protein
MINTTSATLPVNPVIIQRTGQHMNIEINVSHLSFKLTHRYLLILVGTIFKAYSLNFVTSNLQSNAMYTSDIKLTKLHKPTIYSLDARYVFQNKKELDEFMTNYNTHNIHLPPLVEHKSEVFNGYSTTNIEDNLRTMFYEVSPHVYKTETVKKTLMSTFKETASNLAKLINQNTK